MVLKYAPLHGNREKISSRWKRALENCCEDTDRQDHDHDAVQVYMCTSVHVQLHDHDLSYQCTLTWTHHLSSLLSLNEKRGTRLIYCLNVPRVFLISQRMPCLLQDTSSMRTMYESELREARTLIADTQKQRDDLEKQIRKLLDELAEYRRKYGHGNSVSSGTHNWERIIKKNLIVR